MHIQSHPQGLLNIWILGLALKLNFEVRLFFIHIENQAHFKKLLRLNFSADLLVKVTIFTDQIYIKIL